MNAKSGDAVVVTKLDRLGRTAKDILDTQDQFAKRGVRVIVIQFLGGQVIDMDSTVGRLIVIFFAGLAQFEGDMIGERTAEALQWRRQQGLACNRPGFGRRKVGKGSQWDMQQLAYIAEIAERLGKGEDVVLVVADFWGRGIKDHRGLLWGQVQHKNGDGNGNGKGSPFEWYWRATRWFHRMKHAGKLPPPYCDTAHTIPETRLFTVEKRHKRPNSKPVIDEKAAWTAEQWREWFAMEFPQDLSGRTR